VLVIDSSHGACAQVVEQTRRVRAAYPAMQLIVGNVASYASAKYLLQHAPPDALKVGIGPVCVFAYQ
jgi:IMP dehydrogenase